MIGSARRLSSTCLVSGKMNTLLERTVQGLLRTSAPGARHGLSAHPLGEMPRTLTKRLRRGALHTVTRVKRAPEILPIPSGRLVFQVQGTTNVRDFLTDGRDTALAVLDVFHLPEDLQSAWMSACSAPGVRAVLGR